jgi:hypothetical protein
LLHTNQSSRKKSAAGTEQTVRFEDAYRPSKIRKMERIGEAVLSVALTVKDDFMHYLTNIRQNLLKPELMLREEILK